MKIVSEHYFRLNYTFFKSGNQYFIANLQEEVQGKIVKWISLLQEYGPTLKRPYADKLRDKIYELRLSFGKLEIRILYFFWNSSIILTNGFLKKTRSVPESEIEKAINYMNDFIKRNGGGEK